MQLTNEWISGFVDGEGSFKIQKITNKGHEKESIVIFPAQHPLVIEDEKPFTGEKRMKKEGHCFIVSQDKRSLSVLYGLKRKFKCGTVHKAAGNMMAFQVSKSIHLEKIIIPFFQKYTLKSTKRESFRLFVESMEKSNKVKTRETEKVCSVTIVSEEKSLSVVLSAAKLRIPPFQIKDLLVLQQPSVTFEESDRCQGCKFHKIVDKQRQKESYPCDAQSDTTHKVSTFPILSAEGIQAARAVCAACIPSALRIKGAHTALPAFTYNFSDNWFCGFIDAQGCFSVSLVKDYPRVQLFIGVQSKEKEMLVELQKFLKCGTLSTRKDGAEIYRVVSCKDLERYIFPKLQRKGGRVLLQSRKRISYQKFRKIVRLIVDKKHLTIEGMEKIKKYKTTLNKENNLLSITKTEKQKLIMT